MQIKDERVNHIEIVRSILVHIKKGKTWQPKELCTRSYAEVLDLTIVTKCMIIV